MSKLQGKPLFPTSSARRRHVVSSYEPWWVRCRWCGELNSTRTSPTCLNCGSDNYY